MYPIFNKLNGIMHFSLLLLSSEAIWEPNIMTYYCLLEESVEKMGLDEKNRCVLKCKRF